MSVIIFSSRYLSDPKVTPTVLCTHIMSVCRCYALKGHLIMSECVCVSSWPITKDKGGGGYNPRQYYFSVCLITVSARWPAS